MVTPFFVCLVFRHIIQLFWGENISFGKAELKKIVC